MNEQSELIASVLGEVVEIGDQSPQAIELGEAVSRHVANRPVVARAAPEPGVAALLRNETDRCPLCGRGGEP